GLPLTRHDATLVQSTRQNAMAERTADVQAHWTRPGVLARIDAALTDWDMIRRSSILKSLLWSSISILEAWPPLASRLSGLHLRRTAGFSMLAAALAGRRGTSRTVMDAGSTAST